MTSADEEGVLKSDFHLLRDDDVEAGSLDKPERQSCLGDDPVKAGPEVLLTPSTRPSILSFYHGCSLVLFAFCFVGALLLIFADFPGPLMEWVDFSRPSLCFSSMLNSAVNNPRPWHLSPKCARPGGFIDSYVESGQYSLDFSVAAETALSYFLSLPITSDGKDVLVLDIDETSLSNMVYLKDQNYGSKPFDSEVWRKWIEQSRSRPMQPMVRLAQEVQQRNVSIVFITGRRETSRNSTLSNLRSAGYSDWILLMMRSETIQGEGETALAYKTRCREHLAASGYRILGSVGDQWSDINGGFTGSGTFKMPNPFYFVA